MRINYYKYFPLGKFMDLDLDANEMLFCAAVMSFSKDDKTLRAGYDNIAAAVPCSARTLRRVVESCRKKGLVNVASGAKERNANTYYPTDKLKSLYGQNGHINKAKMATHTPSKEGYNTEDDAIKLRHLQRKYAEYVKNFGIDYANARLPQFKK